MFQFPSSSKKQSLCGHCSSLLVEGDSASSDRQSLNAKAKKLLGYDPYPLINFLGHLFSKDANPGLRSEAEDVYNYVKKHYPNSLASRTSELYLSSPVATTRRRCMTLLHRLLHQDGIWNAKNFTIMVQNHLKRRFLDRLKEEDDSIALKALISLVSEIGAEQFRKHKWRLLFEYMFESLGSTSNHEKNVASRLFKELIPKCPELFSPDFEILREALQNLMRSNSSMVSAPAVGAGLNLVRYLAPSETHGNYRKYLIYAESILQTSINDNEHEYGKTILEDLLELAENEIGFLKLNSYGLFHTMVVIAEMSEVDLKIRQLAIEFVLKVAENREYGCVMKNMPNKVRRLLAVLVEMLDPVEVDHSLRDWLEAESDNQDSGVFPANSFAMNSLNRIAIAVRGKVIGTEFLESLKQGMDDTNWKIRHASVIALGLVSKGCSQIILRNLGQFVDKVRNLLMDNHQRVQWAAIHTVGQFCKDFSPSLQEQFHPQLVPAITRAMGDFRNPTIQADATLAMQLFSQNCCPSTLKSYLDGIISKILIFLQMEKRMLKEAALTTLASLAASSKEDFLEYYDVVMPYLKVILFTANKNVDCFLIAKTVECITMVGLAVGKEKFHSDAEKVIELLISLQESEKEMDGPVRSRLLQAWGRLCKSLGIKFLPFLSVAMPQLIQSLHSTNNLTGTVKPDDMEDLDDDRVTTEIVKIGLQSEELNEKASACNVFCWLAAELKGRLHLWIYEVQRALVPLINFKLHEEVRTAAISGMPFLLQSAVSATKKGLPLDGFSDSPIKSLTGSIIPALIDALWKEPKTECRAKILEALNNCMQIAGCYLNKDQMELFLDNMDVFLTTFTYKKTEKEKRVNEGLDLREQELIEEEIKQEEEVYQKIGDSLGTFVKTHKASLVPLFNKILPFIERLWEAGKTAQERNIGLRIFRDFAEKCPAGAHSFYWRHCLPILLEACNQKNPEVQKVVAGGIAICAEFGQVDFKYYVEDAVSKLSAIIQHPKALLPRNVMAHEAAISALGRICVFHIHDIKTPGVFSLWLSYLPIKSDLEEAKIVHDQLCSVLGMWENYKVIGPEGANIPMIVGIFAEVLWAGNHLAKDETINWMKKLLKRFQQETSPEILAFTWSRLPDCQRKMLEKIL